MENDELTRYLAALEREGCYRVADTLKESPHEVTQRVFFVSANGNERGPFIRKLIDRDSGIGGAYRRIYEAQRAGTHFEHLPDILECYHDERYLVVVMELVHGETAQNVVYRRDPSLQLASELFPLICDAVIELHELFDPPLIHRDLKPSNAIYDGTKLTIIDFGIARDFKQGAESDTVKFGTRAFAPPEQFGFGQTTVQSDVYSLGMLLYFCLTEKIPKPKVRDARFATSDIPACMQPVLARATALDTAERYTSVAELKNAFIKAAETETPAPEGEPEPPAVKTPAKRRRMGVIVGAFIAAAAIAAAIALAGTGMFGPASNAGGNPAASSSASQALGDNTTSNSSSTEASADGSGSAEDGAVTSQASTSANTNATVATQSARTSAPPRDGFDPATNKTVEIAGITFQIPAYFGEPVAGESGVSYYYAESGSSCAMLMTVANPLEPLEGGEARDPKEVKDGYLGGILRSGEAFTEVISATDFTLAGYSARIAAFRGTTEGLPMTTEVVYYYNPDDDSIGTFAFGQTDNAQFDYSADFAKSVATATPAHAQAQ